MKRSEYFAESSAVGNPGGLVLFAESDGVCTGVDFTANYPLAMRLRSAGTVFSIPEGPSAAV